MSTVEARMDAAYGFRTRVDDLRGQLFSSGSAVYVFVDPLLKDPFDRSAWGCFREPRPVHVIALRRLGLTPAQCPYFFELESPLHDLLELSLAQVEAQWDTPGTPHSVCGWFASQEDPVTLQSGLRSVMDRRLPDGRRWFLRFFDPRVMRHLPRISGGALPLPGIRGWWHGTEHRALCSIPVVSQPAAVPTYTDRQREAIDRIGPVNQAYAQWLQRNPPVPDDAFEQLDAAIETALQCGLSLDSKADCVSFALHRCLIHPRIERHPRVAQWLEAARHGRGGYARLAHAASLQEWTQIQSGNWESEYREVHHG